MTDDKKDLTRIEGINSFVHEEDPEVENFFRTLKEHEQSKVHAIPDFSLSELESVEAPPSTPPDIEEQSVVLQEESAEPPSSADIFQSETSPQIDFSSTESESPTFEENSETFQNEEVDFAINEVEVDSTPANDLAIEELPQNVVDESLVFTNEIQLEPRDLESEKKIETPILTVEKAKLPYVEENTSNTSTSIKPESKSKIEDFKEIKEFGNLMAVGDLSGGGNPPYALVIRNIIFQDECQDILIILKEHGLVKASDEENMLKSLQRGTLLLSQLSEYAVIILAHKLRRFHLDLSAGLSDEIHPPKGENKSKELLPSHYKGLTNKYSLYQNQHEHIDFESFENNPEQILISTTSTLDGLQIVDYLGIVTEYTLIDEEDFIHQEEFSKKINKEVTSPSPIEDKESDIDTLISSLESTISEAQKKLKLNTLPVLHLRLEDIYTNLANKLKIQALKLKGNAVIGINYQITPLMAEEDNHFHGKYKVICTGNVVWATKI